MSPTLHSASTIDVLQHVVSTFYQDPQISSESEALLSDSTTTSAPPATTNKGTVLYLAYGSNLSSETFRGRRGIKPLSSTNVHVPNLDLTFDLAGLPYVEPCFANTQYRNASSPPTDSPYHKQRWTKGLVGVVYEVTIADFRTIIATEGGGSSYQDVVVDCYPLAKDTPIVDRDPKGAAMQAHTLLCPRTTSNGPKLTQVQRPDPAYAQPSARYLKLITDGADEHSLPQEYKDYLHGIRPYMVTTYRQRVGQLLFVASWFPILLLLMGFANVVADKDGKMPKWLARFMDFFFGLMWSAYDIFFKRSFGDGERSIKDRVREDEEIGCKKIRWCKNELDLR